MLLAALAVPQGGARNTPLTAGCRIQFKTALWSSSRVRSKEMMRVKAPAAFVLSTATELMKPCLLKHAVTPPVPAKLSRIIESCTVMQTDKTEKVFFGMSCRQFKRGTGMLEMFSRFVTVGLGMSARFCTLFSNLHGTTLFAFLACALFQPNLNKQTQQTAVDVEHGSHVEHCT